MNALPFFKKPKPADDKAKSSEDAGVLSVPSIGESDAVSTDKASKGKEAAMDAKILASESMSSSSADEDLSRQTDTVALKGLRGKSARNPLVRPYLTEKSGRLAESGVYTFIVDRDATKVAIKRAVAERYRVKVANVRTIVTPASIKRRGARILRKRSAMKKAFVALKKGEKIESISA